MEKPFFEFDLTKEELLEEELSRLYTFSHNLQNYKTVVYRGGGESYGGGGYKHFSSYEEADKELERLLSICESNHNIEVAQINLSGEQVDWKHYPNLYQYIKNKTFELYGDAMIIRKHADGKYITIKRIQIDNPLLTIYRKGCVLTNHSDGYGPNMNNTDFFKPANLLLYLNKNYDKNWGGCFIVDNINVVSPDFGKLVFLNFNNGSNPEHQVNKVIHDVNRVALLFNVQYKLKEREIWKIG